MTEITLLMEPKMLLRSLAASSLAVALLIQVATPSEAATLIDENFSTGTPGLEITTTIPSFTVTSGSVDIIGGAGSQFDFYPGNDFYIDLNGGEPGTLTSSAFDIAGSQDVTLTFNYGANGENRTTDIFFGSTFLGSVTASQSTGTFNTFTTTFTIAAPTTGSLIFQATNLGASGIVLDNVVLTTAPSAVPEPDTLPALLTLGAVGGALVLRRKQNAEQA
jgi:hypothetical protein